MASFRKGVMEDSIDSTESRAVENSRVQMWAWNIKKLRNTCPDVIPFLFFVFFHQEMAIGYKTQLDNKVWTSTAGFPQNNTFLKASLALHVI